MFLRRAYKLTFKREITIQLTLSRISQSWVSLYRSRLPLVTGANYIILYMPRLYIIHICNETAALGYVIRYCYN